jgi:nicotinate-nucleotide adenylyltransferase
MNAPRRIGVFGGTFDPIHNAHIDAARTALDAARLDLVLFVVAARPPHKAGDTGASGEQRLAMVRAALAGEPLMEACDLEFRRDGPSYTYQTLQEIQAAYPGAKLFLIIGLDSLRDLPNWKNPEDVLSRAELLVLPRPANNHVPGELGGRYTVLPFRENAISSTEIRRRVAGGEPIADLAPPAVVELIEKEGLYATRI